MPKRSSDHFGQPSNASQTQTIMRYRLIALLVLAAPAALAQTTYTIKASNPEPERIAPGKPHTYTLNLPAKLPSAFM
jgi:hypothetical protein